jgi:hypothetical protein
MRTRFRCVCLSSVSRLHYSIVIKQSLVFLIIHFFSLLLCSRYIFCIVLFYVLHVFAPDGFCTGFRV